MIDKNRVRSKHKKSLLPLILAGTGLIFLSIAVIVFVPRGSPPTQAVGGDGIDPPPAVVNLPSPEIELVDLNGTPVSLPGIRDQVVLVNNWATWCPPCRAEMPVLESYFRTHKNDGFTLIGINVRLELQASLSLKLLRLLQVRD